MTQFKKHVTEVRAKLQKEGLPVSAKGVTVMVIGEGDTAHSQAITRTIAGKVGLAQGADVHVPDDGGHRDKYVNNHRYTDELNKKGKSTLSVDDLAKIGIVKMEAALYAAREEIGTIRKNLPADGKTRIGSISWGANSPLGMASEAVGKLGHKDPIMKTAELEWAMKNKVKFDRTDPSHVIGARVHLTEKIAGEIKKLQNDKTNQENFKNLKTGLENELAEARKKGLLVINAAGNDHEVANVLGDPKSSTIIFDSIKGLVTVGATDLRTPKNAKMWEGSAEGKSIEIAAPGVELPVGVENNRTTKETGTSFAAPYVASVAALMIKANPKITPDQIEAILTSGRVTVDLAAGDRDGTGLLDPVKAVKEAKKLLSTR